MLDRFPQTTQDAITAGAIIVGCVIAGLIIERVVMTRVRRYAQNTSLKFDDVVVSALRGIVFFGFVLLGVYLALPYLPLSEGWQGRLTTWLFVAAMAVGVVAAMRLVTGIVLYYAHTIMPTSASIVRIIVNIIVLVIGTLVIFKTLGVDVTPVLTALGVGGLAVALALQDTLANLFAGVHLLAMKQINTGDYVTLDSGQEGFIEDIGWRATTIRMLRNNLIVVPNTKLAQAIITNYNLPAREMSVLVGVGVAYDSDLEHVERVAKEVAREVVTEREGGVKEFDPLVRFYEFGDSSINFNVIFRSREFVDQYSLTHEFVKALHKRFGEEGIEIPFPIRTVYMKGGES